MLTRQTAIERLRTTGTLALGPSRHTAITREQAKDPAMRAIGRIITTNAKNAGARCVASSANHVVLP